MLKRLLSERHISTILVDTILTREGKPTFFGLGWQLTNTACNVRGHAVAYCSVSSLLHPSSHRICRGNLIFRSSSHLHPNHRRHSSHRRPPRPHSSNRQRPGTGASPHSHLHHSGHSRPSPATAGQVTVRLTLRGQASPTSGPPVTLQQQSKRSMEQVPTEGF